MSWSLGEIRVSHRGGHQSQGNQVGVGELYGITILWGARERGSPSTGCRVDRGPGLTDTWFRKGEKGQVLPRGGEGLTLVPRWLTIQRLLVTVAGGAAMGQWGRCQHWLKAGMRRGEV